MAVGGNAFSEGLIPAINSEKMTYAREMLSGLKPARDDIPCTTCDLYHAMRDHSGFISRDEGQPIYGFEDDGYESDPKPD